MCLRLSHRQQSGRDTQQPPQSSTFVQSPRECVHCAFLPLFLLMRAPGESQFL